MPEYDPGPNAMTGPLDMADVDRDATAMIIAVQEGDLASFKKIIRTYYEADGEHLNHDRVLQLIAMLMDKAVVFATAYLGRREGEQLPVTQFLRAYLASNMPEQHEPWDDDDA
jgi:hypothetical protein